MSGYHIAADGRSITCGQCGATSHNLTDVAQRYCGSCHIFHEDCSAEFKCRDCGRLIVQFGGPVTEVCATCTVLPGWHRDPVLRRYFDPEVAR
jgi:hypothetical protein